MSKELTPLEALEKIREKVGKQPIAYFWGKNKIDYDRIIIVDDYCDTIETALKDYERLLKMRKTAEWADEKLQTKKKIKAFKILKDLLNVWEDELPFGEQTREVIINEIKKWLDKRLSQEDKDLLKEVLL